MAAPVARGPAGGAGGQGRAAAAAGERALTATGCPFGWCSDDDDMQEDDMQTESGFQNVLGAWRHTGHLRKWAGGRQSVPCQARQQAAPCAVGPAASASAAPCSALGWQRRPCLCAAILSTQPSSGVSGRRAGEQRAGTALGRSCCRQRGSSGGLFVAFTGAAAAQCCPHRPAAPAAVWKQGVCVAAAPAVAAAARQQEEGPAAGSRGVPCPCDRAGGRAVHPLGLAPLCRPRTARGAHGSAALHCA